MPGINFGGIRPNLLSVASFDIPAPDTHRLAKRNHGEVGGIPVEALLSGRGKD
jgi:hypothetical protein